MAHSFDVGDDLFSFANDDWALVSRRTGSLLDGACAKDGAGEYIAATKKTYNARTEVTLLYRAKKNDAALAVAVSLGLADTTSAYIPTSARVNTKIPGHAEVEITGHKHGDSTHEVNSIDVSCTVDGWGATDLLSGTPDDGCQSCTWTASIEHKDALKKSGDHLCGRSQGCKIEAEASIISDTAPALDSDWTDNGSEIKEGEDFWTASLRGVQYLEPAAA